MKIAQLPQRRKKENIILAILLIVLPLVLFAAYQVVKLATRAGGDTDPKNVVIGNITTSMVTISWTTDTKTYGSVSLIENGNEKTPKNDSRGTNKRYTHYVELSGLENNTQYDFIIKSDNKKYTSSEGKNLTFKTIPISGGLLSLVRASGKVEGALDDDILVYILLSDKSSLPVITTFKNGRTWYTDLANMLNISDRSNVDIKDSTIIKVLAVDGRGRAAMLNGTYSSLFGSEGTLVDQQTLTLQDNLDIYTSIPQEAKLLLSTSQEPVTPPSLSTNKPVKPVIPSPEPTSPDHKDIDTDTEIDIEFTNRKYRIVHQLPWSELVETQKTVSNSGEGSIKITNVTDTGFTVLWISGQKESGSVNYGTSKTALNSSATDQRDGITTKGTYYVHSVKVDRVQPETTYYFEIISGTNKYNKNGNKYTVTTHKTLTTTPKFVTVSGEINNLPDNKEVVIIGSIKDGDNVGTSGMSMPVSEVVNEDGSWTMSIADMRTSSGDAYYEYTSGDSLIIEPYTTFSTEQATEKIDGIDSKDITVVLEKKADSATTTKTISATKLSNYGITDSPNAVIVHNGTAEIPKTGITDSFLGTILLSISLILGGILIYSITKKKGKINDKMTTNL